MKCREVTDDLILDAGGGPAVADHLQGCRPCRTRADEVRLIAGALKRSQEAPPPVLLAHLDVAVLSGNVRPTAKRRISPRTAWAFTTSLAAASLIVSCLAWLERSGLQRPATEFVVLPPQHPTPPVIKDEPPPVEVVKLTAPEKPVELPKPILRGDLNGDGAIDIADRLMLARVLSGVDSTADLNVADLNGDGQIDIGDDLVLCRTILSST